jgi:hypothetical protein
VSLATLQVLQFLYTNYISIFVSKLFYIVILIAFEIQKGNQPTVDKELMQYAVGEELILAVDVCKVGS